MQAVTVFLGRGAIRAQAWVDGDATVASTDGCTTSREEMAQTLEALAAYVRTGKLGELPEGVHLAEPRVRDGKDLWP